MTSLSRRRFLTGLALLPFAPAAAKLARVLPAAPTPGDVGAVAEAPFPATIPPGTIFAHAGECPPGWLPCDGRLVGVKEYPALYKAIGQAYGVNPTAYEFRVPNLNARHTHGLDDGHRHAWVEAVPLSHAHASHDHSVYVHLYAPAPRYVVKA